MEILIGLIILVVFVVLLRMVLVEKDPAQLGIKGEYEVSSILHSLPQEYYVIDNVIIPDQYNKHTTQIDHIVVSPFGVFVIETKNYSGWIFGSEDSKRWKQTFKTESHYLYNPIKQNWGHTFALAEHLKLSINVFKPIVVFTSKCELNLKEIRTPVIYTSQLKGLILNYKQEIIPRNDVALIYQQIYNINLIGDEFEQQHIQSIGERLSEKETAIQSGRCPQCGGELKLRNGKYGQFYGCSNYPKCRYTLKVR